MNKNKLWFVVGLVVFSGLSMTNSRASEAASSCIAIQDAYSQSVSLPSTTTAFPALPAGWAWTRVYQISWDIPTPYHWISWVDGITLDICPDAQN